MSETTRLAWSTSAAVSLGRDEAERDAEQDREHHRRDRELDRRREALAGSPSVIGRRDGDARAEVPPSPRSCRYASTARRAAGRGRTGCGSARSPRRRPLAEQRLARAIPGSARIQTKTRSESPIRIGTSRSSRRTAKRSMEHFSSSAGLLVTRSCSSLADEPDGRERLERTPGSGCSRRRSSGTPSAGFVWTYGTPGRNSMIMLFACLVHRGALRRGSSR